MKNLTDLELIILYQKRNEAQAFNELFRRYKNSIYKYSHQTLRLIKIRDNETILDVIQEYTMRFIERINKIDLSRIKDYNRFDFCSLLYMYLNAYKKVILNKYKKQTINFKQRYMYEGYEQEQSLSKKKFIEDFQDKRINLGQFIFMDESTTFLKTLSDNDFYIVKELLSFTKKINIAKNLSISAPKLSRDIKKISEKFRNYTNNM